MVEAEVGDDVYGEDPTVNRLEERAAEIAGKQAALFVPTGTMGNTIGIKLLTEHGQEVICDSRAHLLDYELSMMAWFSGCVIRAIADGTGIAVRRRGDPQHPPGGPVQRAHRGGLDRADPQHGGRNGVPHAHSVRDLRRRARARSARPHGWRAHLQRVGGSGHSRA